MWFLAQSDDLYNSTVVVTTTSTDVSGGFWAALAALWFVWLVVIVIAIIALWKLFTKAGQPGWKAIIPIYNMWVLCEIAGRPGWWALTVLIPFVGSIIFFVLSIIVSLDLAKSFGKSPVFGIVGLWLFSIVGYLILGFGDAKYVGPAGASGGSTAAQA